MTITDRAKRKKDNKNTKNPGTQTVLPEEVEDDIKSWILVRQKLDHPVTRDMVLIKDNKMFLGVFGMKKRSRQVLGSGHVNISLIDHGVLSYYKEGDG